MTELEQKEYEFHAKQLLDNPVFINTLESINKDIGREMDRRQPNKDSELEFAHRTTDCVTTRNPVSTECLFSDK